MEPFQNSSEILKLKSWYVNWFGINCGIILANKSQKFRVDGYPHVGDIMNSGLNRNLPLVYSEVLKATDCPASAKWSLSCWNWFLESPCGLSV
ncbi:hypothetical protein Peur_065784 [Populus x canadensis]